ncbi:MAG TPA: ATP synthase subunit I [Halalkalibaculum sp.]|nr:ATP synthase subunit I [Halalkalibaculum sp.]
MDWIIILFALISGAISGLIYFGGLWLTLNKIAEYKLSYTLLLLSFAVRLALVLLIFYALVIYHWAYLAIALISFLAMRQYLLVKLGKDDKTLIHESGAG